MAFIEYEPEKNLNQEDVNFILNLIYRDLMKNAEAWAISGEDFFLGQAVGFMHSYNAVMLKVDKQKANKIFNEHFALFWAEDCLSTKEAS